MPQRTSKPKFLTTLHYSFSKFHPTVKRAKYVRSEMQKYFKEYSNNA
jgi:hypothetical protein